MANRQVLAVYLILLSMWLPLFSARECFFLSDNCLRTAATYFAKCSTTIQYCNHSITVCTNLLRNRHHWTRISTCILSQIVTSLPFYPVTMPISFENIYPSLNSHFFHCKMTPCFSLQYLPCCCNLWDLAVFETAIWKPVKVVPGRWVIPSRRVYKPQNIALVLG